MEKKIFKIDKKENKVVLNATIDKPVMEMVLELMKQRKENLSSIVNGILKYFKKDLDDGTIIMDDDGEES